MFFFSYSLSLNANVQTPSSEPGDDINTSHDALMHFNLIIKGKKSFEAEAVIFL